MIWPALIAAGLIQIATLATDERGARLELLRRAASARFYADDQFRCDGLSARAARQRARRALGRDFDERLSIVARQLTRLYGERAVQEQTELIAIGYKITPARCAEARGMVGRARESLAKLESFLGAS